MCASAKRILPAFALIVANARFRFYGDTALLTEVERYGEGDDFPKFETTSIGSAAAANGSWFTCIFPS